MTETQTTYANAFNTTYEPSAHQVAIFNEFKYGTDNFVVEAYAGVGKTTTAIDGMKLAPEARILMSAFSKQSAVDLNAKLKLAGNTKAEAKTTHALGYSIVRKFRKGLKVDNANHAEALTLAVCPPITITKPATLDSPEMTQELATPDAILKLVTKLHTHGRETAPHALVVGDLTSTAVRYECEPDEEFLPCILCSDLREYHVSDTHAYTGYDLVYLETKALAAMALSATVENYGTIDFADMIFLPVRNHWMAPQYDLVVIDEAQDLTLTQLEIMEGVCKGRIVVIGDRNQAIYAFRGADAESLDRLKIKLSAKAFKLPITYRCGRRIVREAQRYVADFEAGPENDEGDVRQLAMSKLINEVAMGDFVLSRVNAPLVPLAMKLLRQGKRTRILGKNIGSGLISIVKKFKARSVPDLLLKITLWETRGVSRTEKLMVGALPSRKKTLQGKIDDIHEQADMLTNLADGARNVLEVIDRIEGLFAENNEGDAGFITLSSVHKAKGLEANRVFVLAYTLRPEGGQEEKNIAYVAITRAKQSLIYVHE